MKNTKSKLIIVKPKTVDNKSSLGPWAKSVREALNLTQRELADMAGVSLQEVCIFEKNLPVVLDTKRKLLKILWAGRAARYRILLVSR